MGAGLVALGGLSGCTQFLQRSESSVPLAPAGAGGKAARKRLAQLAREAKDGWKEVLRDYNRWKATGDEKIKLALPGKIRKAKTSALAIADGLDTEGLTPELNEKLAKADFNSVSEAERAKVVRTIVEDLSDTGLSEDEAQKLQQAFMQQADLNTKKKEILRHGGISSYLRYKLATLSVNPSGIDFQPLTGIVTVCWLAPCLMLLAASLALLLANTDVSDRASIAALLLFIVSVVYCDLQFRHCEMAGSTPRRL